LSYVLQVSRVLGLTSLLQNTSGDHASTFCQQCQFWLLADNCSMKESAKQSESDNLRCEADFR